MRVSVRSYDARRARALQETLASGGVEAVALVGPLQPRTHLADDIALLDAGANAVAWAKEEALRIARGASRPAALVAASVMTAPPTDDAAAFDAWIQIDAPEGVVEQELASIHRRAAVRAELQRRIETARDCSVTLAPPPAPQAWRALYIGEPSPFFLAKERALASVNGRLEAAFSSFMGFDFLHEARFDAVTLNAVHDPTTALALCGALRRNARLHHLPTAIIVRRGDAATVAGAVERGATVVVHADEAPDAALRWLFEKVRCGREHAQVEEALAALRGAISGGSGLFPEAFFRSHVARLAGAAQTSGRPFTIAALQIAAPPGARSQGPASWARNVREIGELAGRLVRAQDVAALLEGDAIVVALPDAGLAEGRRVAERVTGVAGCTAFTEGPVLIGHSVVELKPGESGPSLLARALDPFRAEGVRA